jgi:hypothetical protein
MQKKRKPKRVRRNSLPRSHPSLDELLREIAPFVGPPYRIERPAPDRWVRQDEDTFETQEPAVDPHVLTI